MKNFIFLYVCVLLSFAFTSKVYSQVSGHVYRDINNNGSKSAIGVMPFEEGLPMVRVVAYDTASIMMDQTYTDGNGNFSLPSANKFPLRLEFITDVDHFPAKRNSSHNSNIQIVSSSSTTITYGVANFNMFNSGQPSFLATHSAANGDPLNSVSPDDAGNAYNLFIIPKEMNNTRKEGDVYLNKHLGSIFGITYQRETKTIIQSAYLKRHVGFGAGGIDAIYHTKLNNNYEADIPRLLFKLSNLGINVANAPRINNLPKHSNSPNIDAGVFENVGKLGIGNIDLADNGTDLYVTNLRQNKVHRINIGIPIKSNYTAADVTGNWNINGPNVNGTEFHIMAVKCYGGKVYVGGVLSKQRVTAPQSTLADLQNDQENLAAYIYELNMTNSNSTLVTQFPLNYRRGYLLDQFRYAYKNNYWRAWQNNPDVDVLRNDFNDSLEIFPQPAAPFNTAANTGLIYPQPMLSDIEFDVDGSMIVGLRDRFGDQGGLNNYMAGANGSSSSSGGQLFRTFAGGEVLRLGKNGTTWNLENNAQVTHEGKIISSNIGNIQGAVPGNTFSFSGSFQPNSGSPWGWNTTNTFGPGGRYFYYNHSVSNQNVPTAEITSGTVKFYINHYTKANGGVALIPGEDRIVSSQLSPEGTIFSQGLLKFANKGLLAGTNAGNMVDQQELKPGVWAAELTPNSPPSTMGKANGMGDVEFLDEAMPIEIGNKIWKDKNGNGIQDAHETGVPNISITLRSPGADNNYYTADDQTWNTTTDADGHYYFDNSFVNDNRRVALGLTGLPTNSGIIRGVNYRLEVMPTQSNLTGLECGIHKVGANSCVDNDGATVNIPGIGYRTIADINASTNNYDFDFGFKSISLPIGRILEFTAQAQANTVELSFLAINYRQGTKYEIMRGHDGLTWEKVGTVNNNNTPSYNSRYRFIDNSPSKLYINYYKIKSIELDGFSEYSLIKHVKFAGGAGGLQPKAFPNPAKAYTVLWMPNELVGDDITVQFLPVNGSSPVKTIVIKNAGESEQIPLQGITQGVYIMYIQSNNKKFKHQMKMTISYQ